MSTLEKSLISTYLILIWFSTQVQMDKIVKERQIHVSVSISDSSMYYIDVLC